MSPFHMPPEVAIYATVSKEWQKCIEPHTFSSILVTPARLGEFDQVIRGPRRQYVHFIMLDVVLNSYDEEACCRYETEDDQQKNDQIFTRTFQRLFLTMSSWGGVQEADVGIHMNVNVYPPSDLSRLSQEKSRARRALKNRIGGANDILDRRVDKSHLRLVSPEIDGEASVLPHSVSAITKIDIMAGYLRKICPASCSFILPKLPGLRTVNAYLWDNERKDLGLRIRARHAKYTPITPSGQWLFERDPDEEEEEIEWGEDPALYIEEDELPSPSDQRVNHFREKAVPELMNSFYVAAGKAAGEMPVLRQMWLAASTGTRLSHPFQYTATATSASVCWRSTPLFEPSEDVLTIWKEAARKNSDADLEISYVEGY